MVKIWGNITHVAADLASPRWYAAENARVGYNESGVQGKNAKLLNFPLNFPLDEPE